MTAPTLPPRQQVPKKQTANSGHQEGSGGGVKSAGAGSGVDSFVAAGVAAGLGVFAVEKSSRPDIHHPDAYAGEEQQGTPHLRRHRRL